MTTASRFLALLFLSIVTGSPGWSEEQTPRPAPADGTGEAAAEETGFSLFGGGGPERRLRLTLEQVRNALPEPMISTQGFALVDCGDVILISSRARSTDDARAWSLQIDEASGLQLDPDSYVIAICPDRTAAEAITTKGVRDGVPTAIETWTIAGDAYAVLSLGQDAKGIRAVRAALDALAPDRNLHSP